MPFFDIAPILIASTPITNIDFYLLLASRDSLDICISFMIKVECFVMWILSNQLCINNNSNRQIIITFYIEEL